MVPHAIVTVSLATAVLPELSRRAADHDLAALGASLAATLRTCLAFIIPFVMLLPMLSHDLAREGWGLGALGETYSPYAPKVALFAPGIFFVPLHHPHIRRVYDQLGKST